jgi:hypothetical protein
VKKYVLVNQCFSKIKPEVMLTIDFLIVKYVLINDFSLSLK